MYVHKPGQCRFSLSLLFSRSRSSSPTRVFLAVGELHCNIMVATTCDSGRHLFHAQALDDHCWPDIVRNVGLRSAHALRRPLSQPTLFFCIFIALSFPLLVADSRVPSGRRAALQYSSRHYLRSSPGIFISRAGHCRHSSIIVQPSLVRIVRFRTSATTLSNAERYG